MLQLAAICAQRSTASLSSTDASTPFAEHGASVTDIRPSDVHAPAGQSGPPGGARASSPIGVNRAGPCARWRVCGRWALVKLRDPAAAVASAASTHATRNGPQCDTITDKGTGGDGARASKNVR